MSVVNAALDVVFIVLKASSVCNVGARPKESVLHIQCGVPVNTKTNLSVNKCALGCFTGAEAPVAPKYQAMDIRLKEKIEGYEYLFQTPEWVEALEGTSSTLSTGSCCSENAEQKIRSGVATDTSYLTNRDSLRYVAGFKAPAPHQFQDFDVQRANGFNVPDSKSEDNVPATDEDPQDDGRGPSADRPQWLEEQRRCNSEMTFRQ